jgi:hypothetical protein
MITLQAKNGVVELNDITIRALHQAWPTKDVDTELAKMHLWLLAHPHKRPTYFWTFTRNWLRKSPDVTPPPMPVGAGWWRSPEATHEVAKGLGLYARPGEEMSAYRERIAAAIASKRQH